MSKPNLTEPMYIEKYDENDPKRNFRLPPHSNARWGVGGCWGGGNPYGQPDHKILVFLTASLKAFESFAETEKKTVVITFFQTVPGLDFMIGGKDTCRVMLVRCI